MDISVNVRPASSADSQAIFDFICILAEYEKAPEQVINSPEKIAIHGFGENPIFNCWVAELNGKIVGIALCYVRYSTWKGPVLYLEDIVVAEDFRRLGVGTQLFEACLEYARHQNYSRMSWQVLEWNEPAIMFYKKYGVSFDSEWVNCSIDLLNEPLE